MVHELLSPESLPEHQAEVTAGERRIERHWRHVERDPLHSNEIIARPPPVSGFKTVKNLHMQTLTNLPGKMPEQRQPYLVRQSQKRQAILKYYAAHRGRRSAQSHQGMPEEAGGSRWIPSKETFDEAVQRGARFHEEWPVGVLAHLYPD